MDPYDLRKNQRRQKLGNGKFFKRHQKKDVTTKPVKDSFLVEVFQDTISFFRQNVGDDFEESMPYDVRNLKIDQRNGNEQNLVEIEVRNEDTLEMAERFSKEGYGKIMVLNMASSYKPGGGVKSGKTAQEECLFRRSSAFLSHTETLYPLEDHIVLFTPRVTVIKNSNYEMLDSSFDVSMISVSAIRKPLLNNGLYFEDDFKLMQQKIESIFILGIQHQVDCLVLGALGCGVYNNPVTEVSRIFSMMLKRYAGHFKKIGFAILCVRERDYENLREFEKLTRF